MITQNYVNILKDLLQQSPTSEFLPWSGYIYGGYRLISHDGEVYYTTQRIWSDLGQYETNGNFNNIFRLGSDNTPAEKNDYKIYNRIWNITVIKVRGKHEFVNDIHVFNYYLECKNDADEDNIVREIGMYYPVNMPADAQGPAKDIGSLVYVLIDRTVLDEPIVFHPGETKILKYTLKTVEKQHKPDVQLQNKTVIENGTVTPDPGYDGLGQVIVALPIATVAETLAYLGID